MPSTVVAHMDYHATEHILRIVFVSGMIYDYKEVPETVYRAMKSATSKGTFLNKYIKGHYAFTKVK
ncbi:KTSC domain-containing protein [Chitinophaga sp. Ak27]|uniref:KTSC domain-containing protein n=1 Tax=Chitinophaga sp. Ak27 TaxID=2726116 RepID=UPI00145CBC55|nr:KTSC domain-containing protein [Chitinophaga sp. Ak27]NLU93152.1 KTSC domain-containing protein [Chitinophaga sp. Ak27]